MTELEQRMTDDLNWAERAAEVQQNPEHDGKQAKHRNENGSWFFYSVLMKTRETR